MIYYLLPSLLCIALGFQSPARGEQLGKPKLGLIPASKWLFLGNSITLHPPAPGIGWTGDWGMAASSKDKDFVHLMVAEVARETKSQPTIMVRNIADFERGHPTFNIAKEFQKEIDFQADVIIVAIGENVPALKTEESKTQYAQAFQVLLSTLKHKGNPTILVRSCFWADPVKDEIMRKASQEAKVTFVDISKLGADKTNAASAEREFKHAGVAGHPGDKGMKAIADAIMAEVKKIAFPAKP